MTDQPRPPIGCECLVEARRLLRERGWTPKNSGINSPFGPDTGPLTVLNALWRGACWGPERKAVHPPAAAKACTLLGRTLGITDEEVSFTDIGDWCRVPGRTQEEVIRLFDLTLQQAADRLFRVIREGFEEDA